MSASAPGSGAEKSPYRRPAGDRFSEPGAHRYAERWAEALTRLGFVPQGADEQRRLLLALTVRLARAAVAEPFTVDPAYEVGRALVAGGLTGPGVVDWSVRGLGEQFPALVLRTPAGPESEPVARIPALQGALAAGFAQALRARTSTERSELRQRLRYHASHDPLTGLPNRALFLDRLAEVFAGAGPDDRVGLCLLDLDGFKAINDSLGHDLGDHLLVTVARRLAERVAGQGHLVARMGGDEFVILVGRDAAGCGAVKRVAEAALAAVAEPVQIGGHELSVSASIGIVARPVSATTAAELMKAADITLHWAKAAGRGRWATYDPERRAREKARSALVTAMSAALERDEFTVDYQPIVTLADGSIRAAEALVRWRHPELGLLGPDEFIGLAEETGLIVELGRWVLTRACEAASRWLRDFPDARVVVSVNLAARQAGDPTIVSTVSEVLRQTGLPAELLQLELTESAVMATAGEPLPALRRLAALGVRLAIDDFGTGYSNLAYLRRLPIHGLKLAGPFVQGIRSSDRQGLVDGRIVDALVRLAHALGLSVTAEAVETAGQADQLRALGCDAAQGRHFGAPAPEEELTGALAARATAQRADVA